MVLSTYLLLVSYTNSLLMLLLVCTKAVLIDYILVSFSNPNPLTFLLPDIPLRGTLK